MVDLTELLDRTKQTAVQQLSTTTTVVDGSLPIDLSDLRIEAPTWVRYDVTAVVADMVNSTHLGATGQWEKWTAAIYDAAVSPMVQILDAFGADFIDIQGDGGFGLFTGERHTERAVCAAITVRTFSERGLVKALKVKWPSTAPETGFKLGVAASRVLAKKVGISRTSHQEPVWAGRAVNYAAKCAQEAGLHRVLVTDKVAAAVQRNGYLYFPCGCPSGTYGTLWAPQQIGKLGGQEGLACRSAWCEKHVAEFLEKILSGEFRRDDTRAQRAALTQELRAS